MSSYTKDYFFDLPHDLIAHEPAAQRSGSRLMVLKRGTGSIGHKNFFELPSLLNPGDCMVINDSRVIPARLTGKNKTGAKVELLLHQKIDGHTWNVLCKPGRKAKKNELLFFGENDLTAYIKKINEDGSRIVSFEYEGDFETLLEKIGEVPLPHYIKTPLNSEKQKERYQTVYAAHNGSVAAPTAGLHFTEGLLDEIAQMGVRIARVTLHVGLGTFSPVKADVITEHKMHREYCKIAPEQANIINETKKNGGRVIAIGTTSCRTLESRTDENGTVLEGSGYTDIFIYPGYAFKAIDGLVTNFHLPESTLMMLVSAFAGRDFVFKAYEEAIRERYRFYSFGDAMFIL
jgi:S-adenosylmethionine:tRNA ribosyltransferase-isomerase